MNPEALPADVESLQQLVIKQHQEIVALQQLVLQRERHIFGRRSERDTGSSNRQLCLIEVPEEECKPVAEQKETEVKGYKRSKRNGRGALPAHIPRTRKEIHPDEVQAAPEQYKRIGEELTEVLDFKPATFHITEVARIKYKHKVTGEIIIGEIPKEEQPLEKRRPGPGLVAHVLTSKFCDHLPLNRQEQIYARSGVLVNRSTLCDWGDAACEILALLKPALKAEVLDSYCVQTDETPVVQQDRKSKAYLWGFLSEQAKTVVFEYSLTRSGKVATDFFDSFEGFVQADAYSGYNQLFEAEGIFEVGCFAHARRKFDEAKPTASERCKEILKLIRGLYKVERDIKGKKPKERLRQRINRAHPLLGTIRAKLDQWSLEELPESPLGKAIRYTLNQWQVLTRYVFDPFLSIDNNPIERQIRPIAIGRKNWLFTGSARGGKNAALMFSIVNSCKLNGIDPFEYLQDVIVRLAKGQNPKTLTPRFWKNK